MIFECGMRNTERGMQNRLLSMAVGSRRLLPISLLVASVVVSVVAPALATPLDDQVAAFKKADQQSEAVVASILKTGLEEGRAAEAVVVVKPWLDANPSSSAAVDYYAGLAMQRAGEWPGAVTFYRKLLKNPALDPKLAAEVVPAVYRLLLNDMREPDSAYLLMREDGDRLRAFGNAKQFDAWFLAEAKRRGDLPAVCSRVAAIFSTAPAGVVPDTADLEWVCAQLETFAIPDETWLPAALKLVAVPQVPAPYRARVNWVTEIVPYTKEATELFRANKPIPDALADKPLKAAEALVAALPYQGSILAARGWMNIREGHTPNLWKYVAPRRDAKTAPLIKALAGLPVQQAQAVLAAPGCPQGRPVIQMFYAENSATAEMKALVKSLPAVFNSLYAPDVAVFDGALTVAEAQAFAPILARNPGAQAALVRAYAVAGTNTVSAIVPAMMKSELWRFDSAKTAIDVVWNSGFSRDGADYAALCTQYANLGARYDQFSKQGAKEASSQDRMAAFTAIYQELQGGNPATPGLLWLWDGLLKESPPADAEKILQKLVADFIAAPPAALELQKQFLAQVLSKIRFGNPYSGLAFGPALHPGWEDWGAGGVRAGLPGLAADLSKLLQQQMAAGTLSEPIFGLWIHCVNPGTPEAKALFEALVKSAAYARMQPAYHAMAAHRLLFGPLARTPAMLATDPEYVSRELLALTTNATPAEIEAAFKTVLERAAQAPTPVAVVGLQQVAFLPEWSAPTRMLVLSLFNQLSPLGDYPRWQGYERLAIRLVEDAQKDKQWTLIGPYAAGLWRSAAGPDQDHNYKACEFLTAFAEEALKAGALSPALSVARVGLLSRNPGMAPGQERAGRLHQVAGKASVALGVVEIPVDETHPAYPLYKSSAEFVRGNLDSAWALFKANQDALKPQPGEQELSLLRKLPKEYGFWLLRRAIDEGLSGPAETLVKELTVWSRQATGVFSPEQDAELKIAYADLAFIKGALPTARAWYRKVADAREYKGSDVYVRAALGSVTVDRVSKNFPSALEELERLLQVNLPGARSKVHYARAEVLMDQEAYKEALAEVESVLRRDPDHEDARILRGKIEILMRRLVEASEIELGLTRADKVMVPGEVLKINLIDPTLSVSGVGADIEVEVWAKSGDRERVMLHQLGDNKEKFRADVPTMLAPPVAGDKSLQVLGVDEIRFGYSQRFREKMKDLPPDPGIVITIASDAHLTFSAGAFPAREGERKLDIEELGLSSAQLKLGMRMVRPGNPVYLRVTDSDQSKTAGIDELPVSLESSSGDVIRRLLLKETGPYTGEFEGIIPTAGAQAIAFASESASGRDPNMSISAQDYPGWLGNVGDKEKPRTFGVDMNDNVPLGKLTIQWLAEDQALTRFVLQTSLNGRDWITRSRYPDDSNARIGRPLVTSFPTYAGGIPVSVPTGRELPSDWSEIMELTSARASCNYLCAKVLDFSAGNLPIVNAGHPDYGVLVKIHAYFYQPAAAIRRFRLTGDPAQDGNGNTATIFLLDGMPASETSEDPLTIERELAPGLHEFEIWRHAAWHVQRDRKPVLMEDVPGKEELAPCPHIMFNPFKFPEGVQAQIPQPATITAVDGGLDVAFGAHTQARLVRLSIHGFEGVAPGVKKVTLTGRDDKVYLPVSQDFMALRDNKQLEVLPGDQIVARYEDDVTATPDRNRHEGRLGVAFNTATITASFLNYETTTEGRRLLLEPIRRFNLEDAVAIVIDDVDMDGGPEKDLVEFMIQTSAGNSLKAQAVETEEHSGRFIGRVFPVTGTPQRDSEIQIPVGGTLTATYRDMENLDPGIPADRSVTIEHAKYMTPELGAYTTISELLPPRKTEPAVKSAGPQTADKSKRATGPEVFRAGRSLAYKYVDATQLASTPLEGVIGGSVQFDVRATHLALANSSEIAAYVQVGAHEGGAFDITKPGTIKLAGTLARAAGGQIPNGYTAGAGSGPATGKSALDEGRFSFSIPLVLGDRPQRSFATQAEERSGADSQDGLVVQAGDVVTIGYAWKDDSGQVQWKTASLTVGSHAFLDVMNASFNEALDRAFVGEKVFVRVLAPGLDRGPERDRTTVSLKANSGATATFDLRETLEHSGVFKGVFTISYANAELPAELPPVELNGFPVRYGDAVTVVYAASGHDPAQTHTLTINMGADGIIEPFSKRFTGDEMAVKTSFTLSECFFELAKKHRLMDQESLARREMAHARKLLLEAIATHRDDDLRANAEYLLGNLAQEYADLSQNDEAKLPLYQDALARFSKIPVNYPETEFAHKAQFKTALVYEKMGEGDIAVEEYVKLAYKYPDSEHIPEVMSRLGKFFQASGQVFKEQADLIRQKEDTESQAEVLRLDELSYPEFIKAAIIYGKMQERFPDHKLAGLAGLASAQNYMRAHQYETAIEGFKIVVDNEDYDDSDVRAQALFFSGWSYELLAGLMDAGNYRGIKDPKQEAYETYRRVTFDFPDSNWAKKARGRLADVAFAKIIEVEDMKREKLLEAMQYQKVKRQQDKQQNSVMEKLLKR